MTRLARSLMLAALCAALQFTPNPAFGKLPEKNAAVAKEAGKKIYDAIVAKVEAAAAEKAAKDAAAKDAARKAAAREAAAEKAAEEAAAKEAAKKAEAEKAAPSHNLPGALTYDGKPPPFDPGTRLIQVPKAIAVRMELKDQAEDAIEAAKKASIESQSALANYGDRLRKDKVVDELAERASKAREEKVRKNPCNTCGGSASSTLDFVGPLSSNDDAYTDTSSNGHVTWSLGAGFVWLPGRYYGGVVDWLVKYPTNFHNFSLFHTLALGDGKVTPPGNVTYERQFIGAELGGLWKVGNAVSLGIAGGYNGVWNLPKSGTFHQAAASVHLQWQPTNSIMLESSFGAGPFTGGGSIDGPPIALKLGIRWNF